MVVGVVNRGRLRRGGGGVVGMDLRHRQARCRMRGVVVPPLLCGGGAGVAQRRLLGSGVAAKVRVRVRVRGGDRRRLRLRLRLLRL